MQRKLFKDFCANPRNLREKILLHPADIADHRRKNYSKISAQIPRNLWGRFYLIPLMIADHRRKKSFKDFCANPA
jgi:hypothetical protein